MESEAAQPMASAMNSVVPSCATASRGHRILYLYSGPSRPDDGLAFFARQLGSDCVCVDKEFDYEHDLLDQTFWESVKDDLDNYDSYMLSPPCNTFSPARTGQGGPEPLRGCEGPDRYGLRHLSVQQKEEVKQGTVLALRAGETATYAQKKGKWWMIEQPHHREGKPSMWLLDEFKWLMSQPDVYVLTFSQCKYGCRAQKDTDIMTNIPRLEHMAVMCDHPCRAWRIPWSGKKVWAGEVGDPRGRVESFHDGRSRTKRGLHHQVHGGVPGRAQQGTGSSSGQAE